MKSIMLAVGAALAVCACTSRPARRRPGARKACRCSTTAPTEAVRHCRGHPASGRQRRRTAPAASTARTGTRVTRAPGGASRSSLPGAPAEPASARRGFPTGGGGAYRDNTKPTWCRARPTQQQAQEVAAQQARTEGSRAAWWSAATPNFTDSRAARAPRDPAARAATNAASISTSSARTRTSSRRTGRPQGAVVRPEPHRRRPSAGGRHPRTARSRARNTRETAPAFPASVPRSVPADSHPHAFPVRRT